MRRRLGIILAVAAMAASVLAVDGAAAAADDPAAAAETAPTETETFTVGPFDLQAQGSPGDQVNRLLEPVPRPEGDIWVRSIEWALVDGDGTEIPSHAAHLHHIVLLDTARPDHLCSFPSASRFSGTGKELTDFALADPYAYRAPDSPWQGVYHVMNLSDAPITAAIQYTVTWTPADAVEDGTFLDVEPYFLDVTGCWGDSEYTVPGDGGPDSVHEQSRTYTIERDGIAVSGGGHIHDGGIDVVLTHDTDPPTEICRAVAVYGDGHDGHGGGHGHGSLEDVTPCGQVDFPWSAGDQITLTARYMNHEPVLGAMGIMVMYVRHTGPPPPPPEITISDVALVAGDHGPALGGTVVCSGPMEAYIDGEITQDKHPLPITAWGYSPESVACGAEPVAFVLELMSGNGVLTGGTADYRVYAYAYGGRYYANDEALGELRVTGRHDLAASGLVPGGPHEITLDPRMSTGEPTLTGVITCPEPSNVSLDANVRQRVGRNYVRAYGYTNIACDGETSFELPVMYSDGRLAGGPADVEIYAWSRDGENGAASAIAASVTAYGTARPGDTDRQFPDPDPQSPLQVDGVSRTDSGLLASVTYPDCPVGAEFYLDVYLVADGQGRGGRLAQPGAWGSVWGICDGRTEFQVEATGLSANRVAIQAYISWWHEPTATWGEAHNTGRFGVARG